MQRFSPELGPSFVRWTAIALIVHAMLLATLDVHRSREDSIRADETEVAEPISVEFLAPPPRKRTQPREERRPEPRRQRTSRRGQVPSMVGKRTAVASFSKEILGTPVQGDGGVVEENLRALAGVEERVAGRATDLLDAHEPTSSQKGKRRSWRPNRRGGLELESDAIESTIEKDGSISFKEKPLLEWRGGLVFTQRFDEWAMRKAGVDPYLSNKLAMLEETRDMRVSVIKAWKVENTAKQIQTLPFKLGNLWKDGTKSRDDKKRLLFLLWDECAEFGAGNRARRKIEAFIRKNGIVYSEKELKNLNLNRTSEKEFRP